MKIQDVIHFLEEKFPLNYSEDFDNTGLLVGDSQTELKGILITLDTLENVVNEAITKNCNLIVSFHPIIFNGIKKLNGSNYVERAVIKALKNDIAIYALHTAMDNSFEGVNAKICDVLGLENREILIPKKQIIQKLITYCPENQSDKVREALFKAGAGHIGNYSECSFNLQGKGSFKGNEKSNPFVGKPNEIHWENETQIGVIFPKHLQGQILKALFENHPYEEVAYEIYSVENQHQKVGLGMIGDLPKALSPSDFLSMVKEKMQTPCIRHSQITSQKIRKVAVLGGSGAFAIDKAISQKADAFVSSDFKYHDFFKAENRILLADIGHYESEQFTKNLLKDILIKKFSKFAVVLSTEVTNPVKYF